MMISHTEAMQAFKEIYQKNRLEKSNVETINLNNQMKNFKIEAKNQGKNLELKALEIINHEPVIFTIAKYSHSGTKDRILVKVEK